MNQEVKILREVFVICGTGKEFQEEHVPQLLILISRCLEMFSQFLMCMYSLSPQFMDFLEASYKFQAKLLRRLSKEINLNQTFYESIQKRLKAHQEGGEKMELDSQEGVGILGEVLSRVNYYLVKSMCGPYVSYEDYCKENRERAKANATSNVTNTKTQTENKEKEKENIPASANNSYPRSSSRVEVKLQENWGVSSKPIGTSQPFVSAFSVPSKNNNISFTNSKPNFCGSPTTNSSQASSPISGSSNTSQNSATNLGPGRWRRHQEVEYTIVKK
eukprot:TRINITY_DN9135_c0_g1_i1.p1 TRINITY_DN9135_c0_g1~~TRINITY_DN9135_c0_g1_i1.p1  ORF type:complete len:288 (-),score=78.16 TRINITY_DN9135_c0_g1_i1:206-1030(-)